MTIHYESATERLRTGSPPLLGDKVWLASQVGTEPATTGAIVGTYCGSYAVKYEPEENEELAMYTRDELTDPEPSTPFEDSWQLGWWTIS